MISPTVAMISIVALIAGWATWIALRAFRTFREFRGARVIVCPKTHRTAGVHIDVWHAVASVFNEVEPEVRLSDCSLWATRGPCEQRCVNDARRPDATVRSVVTRWYAGKTCVYCGKPIICVQTLDHRAALLMPENITIEWSEIPAKDVPEALRTGLPVCWNCHTAESFRREHPELVTDRD